MTKYALRDRIVLVKVLLLPWREPSSTVTAMGRQRGLASSGSVLGGRAPPPESSRKFMVKADGYGQDLEWWFEARFGLAVATTPDDGVSHSTRIGPFSRPVLACALALLLHLDVVSLRYLLLLRRWTATVAFAFLLSHSAVGNSCAGCCSSLISCFCSQFSRLSTLECGNPWQFSPAQPIHRNDTSSIPLTTLRAHAHILTCTPSGFTARVPPLNSFPPPYPPIPNVRIERCPESHDE